jgi:hypothetical protein
LTDSGTAVIGGKAVPERLNVIDEGTVADGGRRDRPKPCFPALELADLSCQVPYICVLRYGRGRFSYPAHPTNRGTPFRPIGKFFAAPVEIKVVAVIPRTSEV